VGARFIVPGTLDDRFETVGSHPRSAALPAGSWHRFRGALFAYSWADWDTFAKAAEVREFISSRTLTFPLINNLSVGDETELASRSPDQSLSATPASTLRRGASRRNF
jgi:hypothetical protein